MSRIILVVAITLAVCSFLLPQQHHDAIGVDGKVKSREQSVDAPDPALWGNLDLNSARRTGIAYANALIFQLERKQIPLLYKQIKNRQLAKGEPKIMQNFPQKEDAWFEDGQLLAWSRRYTVESDSDFETTGHLKHVQDFVVYGVRLKLPGVGKRFAPVGLSRSYNANSGKAKWGEWRIRADVGDISPDTQKSAHILGEDALEFLNPRASHLFTAGGDGESLSIRVGLVVPRKAWKSLFGFDVPKDVKKLIGI